MENFKNSKIKHKVDNFSGVLIVAIIFTAIISLAIMRILNSGTSTVSDNWMPSVIIAEELNTATSDFRIAEASHVISHDDINMREHEETITLKSQEIKAMFEEYSENLITNEIDAKLLNQAIILWNRYLKIHTEMITYSKNNDTEAAMDIMSDESEKLFDEVSNVFLELVNFNKEGADKASLVGDEIYSKTIIIFILILIISLSVFYKFKTLMIDIANTQEQLRESNEEALLSSKAKSNFLTNMSHEIRTPMNAISGMTDIILRESKDADVNEYATNIKNACDTLLSIINDVLDISKIESGKIEIIESEYSLSSVLHEVLNIVTNRLELKELMFTTNFKHDLPDKLIGDDIRVKQIMVNILNNAIKFTSKGHIAFDVSGDFADGILDLEFSITDTGVGISEEDIDKLFVEFERINTTKNRNIEGTGLGLAISKRLCEMMDGDIFVSSVLREGTTFKVKIKQKYNGYEPIAKIDNPKSVLIFESRKLYLDSIKSECEQLRLKKVVCCEFQSELNDALSKHRFDFIFTSAMYLLKVQEMLLKLNCNAKIILLADNADIRTKYDYTTILLPANVISISNVLNGKSVKTGLEDDYTHFVAPDCKVLIVDDNIVNLKVAQGLMKPYQFKISTAENGEEAVFKIKENKYDLVFMDHMMPIMDGIDATIAVRSLDDLYYKNLPIIALTANAIIGTRDMFIHEGMTDFLAKPIKLYELNDILLKWLPKDKQIFVDENSDDLADKENQEKFDINIAHVDTSLGIKRTGGDFDSYIEILNTYYKDGVKRLSSVRELFDKKNLLDYKIEVHALKSASASVGAVDISKKALLLEEASGNSDWVYLNQNNDEFIQDFNILLENIREALKGFVFETDLSSKPMGEEFLFKENMEKLKVALDDVDINYCEELLDQLFQFNWSDEIIDNITKIKDLVSEYDYDQAIEFIDDVCLK